MPKVWRSLLGRAEVERADPEISIDQWLQAFGFGGLNYALSGTSVSNKTEAIENSFIGYINGLYKSNGIVFACMETRRSLFTEARFQWQKIHKGRPLDLFGTRELDLLETPWPNGTTGELLSRAIQDVDLAGNHYVVREPNRLRRLRPDWVEIVLTAPPSEAVQSDVAGYIYWPGGIHSDPTSARIYTVEEVAHWCPIPDPEAQYRGMSWLTPVIQEVMSDKEATAHKAKFYTNAATPKLSVSLKDTVTKKQFMDFMTAFSAANDGIDNAYKTMYLGGGADVQIIGANMQQLDFKNVQGAGETRIAAAARVHPVIVGLSEGMQGSSLNAGNYQVVKESLGDQTLRPLWRSISAAYQTILRLPPGPGGKPPTPGTVRLWYDDRDVSFLRTDRKDEAEIKSKNAETISKLITAGMKPESVIQAVTTGDFTLLEHSGLVSVQLLPPGETGAAAEGTSPAPPGTPALPPGKAPVNGAAPGKAPAAAGRAIRHGNLGDPGYHTLHPGNIGKGKRKNGRGAWLGSPSYTEEEHLAALDWYVNEGSLEMNSFLRDGTLPRGGTKEEAERNIKILNDLVMIQDPLEDDVEVFHGGPDLNLTSGDQFSDRGFVSNTDEEGIADAFALGYLVRDGIPGQTYSVKLPKGSRALSVWAIDPKMDNESEWISPPGSVFQVTGDNELRLVP